MVNYSEQNENTDVLKMIVVRDTQLEISWRPSLQNIAYTRYSLDCFLYGFLSNSLFEISRVQI